MAGESNAKLLRDYGVTIAIAVIVALAIRFFVIEAYRIPTSAMKPTLEAGDTIFAAKWPYGLRVPGFEPMLKKGSPPARGDIVIFSAGEEHRDFIKRVIGLPGEEIRVRQGRVTIDGKPLALDIKGKSPCGTETLPGGLSHGVCWEPPMIEDFGPEKVPADSVFVIGDLRSGPSPGDSKKSRTWGMVPVTSLKGKALWIWLSVEPYGADSGWFPQIRFERMFRRIE